MHLATRGTGRGCPTLRFLKGGIPLPPAALGFCLQLGLTRSLLNRRYRLFLEFLKEWFVDLKSLQRLEPKLKFPEHFDKLLPIN